MARIASVFGCLGFVVLMSGCGGTQVQRAGPSSAPAADTSVAAPTHVDGLPVAPVFSVEGFEGETIALADYRGRYVLLAFWGSWCPHCVDETPRLKRVHAAFGADERFTMLGLSVDTNCREAREYIAESGMTWDQAFLGNRDESEVYKAYEVRGIPTFVLVDPQGRVVKRGMRGDGIYNAVAAVLAE